MSAVSKACYYASCVGSEMVHIACTSPAAEVAKRAFNSPFIRLCTGAATIAGAGFFGLASTPALAIGTALLTCYTFASRKSLFSEAALGYVCYEYSQSEQNIGWFHQIAEGLWVSAFPLMEKNHHAIFQQIGIKAVVSVVEPHEFEPKFFGTPVTTQVWTELGIEHLIVVAPDFGNSSTEQIADAVAFIHAHRQKGHNVAVHCNAGKGRSPLIAGSYLLTHVQRASAQETQTRMQAKRPQIAMNTTQMNAFNQYHASLPANT